VISRSRSSLIRRGNGSRQWNSLPLSAAIVHVMFDGLVSIFVHSVCFCGTWTLLVTSVLLL
jgi:hypothetical protein